MEPKSQERLSIQWRDIAAVAEGRYTITLLIVAMGAILTVWIVH